ncbi:hypothetical protein C8R47DRAFT_251405 [Mycena vitilis]|nr:hypothetical protein C8R47DRAFT_251405 [Mycena vitilis]
MYSPLASTCDHPSNSAKCGCLPSPHRLDSPMRARLLRGRISPIRTIPAIHGVPHSSHARTPGLTRRRSRPSPAASDSPAREAFSCSCPCTRESAAAPLWTVKFGARATISCADADTRAPRAPSRIPRSCPRTVSGKRASRRTPTPARQSAAATRIAQCGTQSAGRRSPRTPLLVTVTHIPRTSHTRPRISRPLLRAPPPSFPHPRIAKISRKDGGCK